MFQLQDRGRSMTRAVLISRNERCRSFPSVGAAYGAVNKLQSSVTPLLASRKEGWPSDQENIAKHPPSAAERKRASAQPQERTGWFSDQNRRKTTPSASASVASRNFLDDAATPPCGDARRGVTLASNFSQLR